MGTKVVFKLDGYAFPIKVLQNSRRKFTVMYGKQVREGLSLGDAADELGSSIMHLMSCEGKIDNG